MTSRPSLATEVTARSAKQRLFDRLSTRFGRLERPEYTYTVRRDLRIPMRDGVELLGDLYEPTGPSGGTLLVRSPYGWPAAVASMTGGVYAGRGYRVLLARCRGTFGSGGVFEPFVNEVADGADTVAWMCEQPWFEGRFATYGGSYLGFTQWALLIDPPPELATAIISVGPHDFHAAVYSGGAFSLSDFMSWSYQVAHQEDGGILRAMVEMALAQPKLARAMRDLPAGEASRRLFGERASWYGDWISRREPTGTAWRNTRLGDALDRVTVPILLQSGWQDLFLRQTFEQYAHLARRGVEVGLTIGPWTHGQVVTKGSGVILPDALAWIDEHLRGDRTGTRPLPIKLFVTGAAQWLELAAWPPAGTEKVLYPQPGGGLSDQAAPDASRAEFTYDPADPTPSIGGCFMAPRTSGYRNDGALAAREDVLVFEGPGLVEPLEVFGSPVLELAHASDNPNVDVFVRLSEVFPTGKSRNVSDGFLRIDPAASNSLIRLNLDPVAHRFARRSRIRLILAGGAHPHWERNLGTDDDPSASARTARSHRTIDLSGSRLVLPVKGHGMETMTPD